MQREIPGAKSGGTLNARSGTISAKPSAAPTPPLPRPPRLLLRLRRRARAPAPEEAKKEPLRARAGRHLPVTPCSRRRGCEIFQGNRRQGPHAHLPRSVQGQQGGQRQWRLKWIEKGGGYYSECTQAEGLKRFSTSGLTRGGNRLASENASRRPGRMRPGLRSGLRAAVS